MTSNITNFAGEGAAGVLAGSGDDLSGYKIAAELRRVAEMVGSAEPTVARPALLRALAEMARAYAGDAE